MTIPNLVTFSRLLGAIALIFVGLVTPNYTLIILLFAYAGISDWLDGYLARKLNQFSELGEKLDPLADRLYILIALLIALNESIVPLWVLGLVVLREMTLAILFLCLRYQDIGVPPVHYIGKAGTLMLMYAFPLVFLAQIDWDGAVIAQYIGIAFLAWAVVTYWFAGYLYLRQSLSALKGI